MAPPQPQKEIVYNKLLPYGERLEAEAGRFLAQIKGNLARAVQLQELWPGGLFWTRKLSTYIRLYGRKFSKEDHVLFIKLLYELVTIPKLEISMMQGFARLLINLLKKKELLSRDDLELPWRPLHEMLERILYSKTEHLGLNWFPKVRTSLQARILPENLKMMLLLLFDNIRVNSTIIGDFQKEQKKFVQEQQTKKSEAAVPPWVDSNEEETIQQQILALSADKRNFLRDPPAGVQFNFDFDQMYPVAMVMLQEDQLLNRMRFDLVPKHVKEEVFWRNYFYRVSLIKQSAQLTALAAQQQAVEKKEENKGREEDSQLTETIRPKTPPVTIKPQIKSQEDEEEISTSPGVSEFVSDAFDACNLNQEDLRKEMEQLVLDKKKEETSVVEEETADWEKELQQELQEYEVVTESEKRDENWDKEIEEMLQEES